MAVSSHAQPGRCRGYQWLDDIIDTTLVAEPDSDLLVEALPTGLVRRPTISDDRLLNPGEGEYLRPAVCRGIVVASPVAGVGSRRWARVAVAAAGRDGAGGVRATMTAEGFVRLERELIGEVRTCPACGEPITPRGLAAHQARSLSCRWRRAVAEVKALWASGCRDPWSIPGAPLSWTDLNATVRWRRQLRTVRFPRWTAVLLDQGGQVPAVGAGTDTT